ncbi:Holliday junction resolvase RuvX [Candidatus Peregrinibacteria bacterium]|jgi:putative holliday junction resolvase|nr:Holliday junction resolvase RuvX [Candidatus Peregrinibacteria bacterium]MBT4631905.1 Holliday junction resolvase RuvX [Candidatus Peregrinibacteria bacterium]MBT5516549.1 Holliday junction resolvase RuvX [Candidatus Peregrinibacteria bacterium]MBT5824174.1 Holliday junction resolvase RuvX [Candidatus Peregrinibacteria bacterium]
MSLPNKGKILSLDLGTKRTGVALSDPSQRVAFPRDEIEHDSLESLIESLSVIIESEKVVGILVGLPLTLSGTESEQTRIAKEYSGKISEHFNLPIDSMDERFTTQEALKKMQSKTVDSDVAQILLVHYLC